MDLINAITNCISSFFIGEPAIITEIIPRPANKVFNKTIFSSPTTEAEIKDDFILDRLPKWKPYSTLEPPHCSIDKKKRIKPYEYRLYVDLATQINNVWCARKKISVLCLQKKSSNKYLPIVNTPVDITRKTGHNGLQFVLPNGSCVANLTGANRPLTNNQGIAEFTVSFPTQQLTASNDPEIEAAVTVPLNSGSSNSSQPIVSRKTIFLRLLRNTNIPFDTIADIPGPQPAGSNSNATVYAPSHLWCFQPAAVETTANEGIKKLQEIINEVVSRHRGVTAGATGDNFAFLELNGIYNENTKRMLGKYLQRFTNINGGNYPYNLTAIGPDPALLTTIKEDYAPFDPTLEANRGWIVDRRMLVGDTYDITPARIDGLLELYDGVVNVLKAQMRAFGQSYLDCNVFWLHRPIHGPYAAATDDVFVCKNNGVQLRTAGVQTASLVSVNNNPVTINSSEHFLISQQAGGWVKITHTNGQQGWINSNQGCIVKNDRGRFRAVGIQQRNHGVLGVLGTNFATQHTANGVAYTFGGKQTPAQWLASLRGNTYATPDQVVHYNEYEVGYRFGETMDELTSGDLTHKEAGCDCAGFVQNCIINSFFPGTTTRIVPTNIVNTTWLHSSAFVGPTLVAREVPKPASTATFHWVRGADIIFKKGHIVFAAEDEPNILNNNISFLIMQECGGVNSNIFTVFRRKSVRSPFSWWGSSIGSFTFGKVFIWR
jgi:hypothetical protein